MKMKSILLSMLAVATLASCSNVDGEQPQGVLPNAGEAFLSLDIQIPSTSAASRADGALDGIATPGEGTIKKLFILGYNAAGQKVDKIIVSSTDFANIGGSTGGTAAALPVQKVSAELVDVFVIANPTIELEARINNTTTFTQLATVLTASVADFTGAAFDAFTMVNAYTNNETATSIKTDGLKPVTGAGSENMTVSVALERLVSKIMVTQNDAASFEGVNLPIGCDKFTIKGYELTTTNKTAIPYAPVHKYATSRVYREDANYAGADAKVADQFNWIKGATINAVTAAGGFWKAVNVKGGTAPVVTYCLENTNDASAIANVGGSVTKVIVQGEYLINGVTTGNSWVMLDGQSMSLAQLVAEHARLTVDNTNAALVAVMNNFLTTCTTQTTFASLVEANLNAEASYQAVTVTGNTDGKLLRLYQKSMCYFELPINHDQRITSDNAVKLGRWGVVRNNSYTLNFTGVTGVGAPTVTDDVQGEPDFELDPSKSNLVATISVNKWATWTQEGPLEPR